MFNAHRRQGSRIRDEDLEPLREPYAEGQVTQDATYHIARRWGFDVDALQELEEEMDADLDLDEYGIGWWELPTWQRILISHQLIEAVGDVCKNLLVSRSVPHGVSSIPLS